MYVHFKMILRKTDSVSISFSKGKPHSNPRINTLEGNHIKDIRTYNRSQSDIHTQFVWISVS